MKKILFSFIVLVFFSCKKQYTYTCSWLNRTTGQWGATYEKTDTEEEIKEYVTSQNAANQNNNFNLVCYKTK
jgi:hypothetical protein